MLQFVVGRVGTVDVDCKVDNFFAETVPECVLEVTGEVSSVEGDLLEKVVRGLVNRKVFVPCHVTVVVWKSLTLLRSDPADGAGVGVAGLKADVLITIVEVLIPCVDIVIVIRRRPVVGGGKGLGTSGK